MSDATEDASTRHGAWELLAETWGRELFEAQSDPPVWAARVLDAAQEVDPGLAEVETVIAVATDPTRRHLGHEAFDQARRRYLAEQPAPGVEPVRCYLLILAELVAKRGVQRDRSA